VIAAHSLGKPLRIFGLVIVAIAALAGIGSSGDPYRKNLTILIATWGMMISFERSVFSELDLIIHKFKQKLFFRIVMAIIYTAPILSTLGVLIWAFYQHLTLSWSLTMSGALSLGLFFRLYQRRSESPAELTGKEAT
jgi:hypothetical protein